MNVRWNISSLCSDLYQDCSKIYTMGFNKITYAYFIVQLNKFEHVLMEHVMQM